MAFAKCDERTRSGEVEREDATAATEARLDSTFAGFEGRRAIPFGAGLTPFFEAFRDVAFARFPFKSTGLVRADTRLAGFLLVLDLVFVLVAIGLGTYTIYAS